MMTIAQLKKACTGIGYILVTTETGKRIGLNKGMAKIAGKRFGRKYDRRKSGLIGWRECGLNEYINHKYPFAI